MPLSFFSRKKPIVPANKSAANKEANKAAKKDATEKAVKARLKKHSTNAKYTAILNRLSADPVLKKSRRLHKLKVKAHFAKSNLSAKINDFQYRGKGTQKNVENAQDAYNTAYQNLENFANANYVESNNNSSPTKPSPFIKPFPERMKEKSNAYIASKAPVGKLLDLSEHLPISEENQKLLNEASNDDLEQQVATLNNSPNELEQQVATLNNSPNELEQQVATLNNLPNDLEQQVATLNNSPNDLEQQINALSSDSEDEDQVVQPRRTPFYRGKRSLKSKKGRKIFRPKLIENYERSHPKRAPIYTGKRSLKSKKRRKILTPKLIKNHINAKNIDDFKEYFLKVRPHDIRNVQNRSAELNPVPSPESLRVSRPELFKNSENVPLNHISNKNMDGYKEYFLKVRPYDIRNLQNRSAELNPVPSLDASTSTVPLKVDNLKERARLQLAIQKYKEAKSKGPYLNEHENMLVAWIHHLSKR